MLKRLCFSLLLLAGCSRTVQSGPPFGYTQTNKKPHVALLPFSDHVKTKSSVKATHSFAKNIILRLEKKQSFNLSVQKTLAQAISNKQDFLVSLQLLEHFATNQSPSELSMSFHLQILDIRDRHPKVVHDEIIHHNTLLPSSMSYYLPLSWENKEFRITALGLAHTKIAREITMHIEEYITVARKG